MKKTLITSIIGLATAAAMAQGTVNFANLGAGLNAPIKDMNSAGLATAGGWDVALLTGGTVVDLIQNVNFVAPGYFNGGTVIVSSIAPGASGTFTVEAWSAAGGNTLAAATATAAGGVTGLQGGTSAPFTIAALGGAGSPATLPASLTLVGFSLAALPTPEPSTIALGVLGLGAIALRRRK